MIFIFGFDHEKIKHIGPLDKETCAQCKQTDYHLLLKASYWFTLFFLPVFPYRTRLLVSCSVCSFVRDIDKEEFEHLLPLAEINKAAANGTISEEDFEKSRNDFYAR